MNLHEKIWLVKNVQMIIHFFFKKASSWPKNLNFSGSTITWMKAKRNVHYPHRKWITKNNVIAWEQWLNCVHNWPMTISFFFNFFCRYFLDETNKHVSEEGVSVSKASLLYAWESFFFSNFHHLEDGCLLPINLHSYLYQVDKTVFKIKALACRKMAIDLNFQLVT